MAHSGDWATIIRICSILLVIIGVLSFVMGIVSYAFMWSDIVLGIVYIAVGARGFTAGSQRSPALAKQYFRGLVTATVLMTVLSVIDIIVTCTVEVPQFCRSYSYDTASCSSYKSMVLMESLFFLFASIAICIACLGCARAYMKSLNGYTPEGGYQQFTDIPHTTVFTAGPVAYGAPGQQQQPPQVYTTAPYAPQYVPAPTPQFGQPAAAAAGQPPYTYAAVPPAVYTQSPPGYAMYPPAGPTQIVAPPVVNQAYNPQQSIN